MSDNGNFGFGKFVPGFDFLQNIAKGASGGMPQMPSLSNWVAPTLNVEELEKRIAELKAVHFWLDQNGKALGATIQALEVQKMTLATLQGMNFSMGDLASALKLKPSEKPAPAKAAPAQAAATEPSEAGPEPVAKGGRKAAAKGNGAAGAAPVDPLQWWGSLTQQFQEIAAGAMKDATQKTAIDAARNMATGAAKEAMKAATGMAKKTAARKPAPRKTKAKTS